MCGQCRIASGNTERVQCNIALGDEAVPFCHMELGTNSAEPGNQVVFVGPDCPLCRISSMDVGRDTLEGNIIFPERGLDVLCTLVINDMEVWGLPMCLEGVKNLHPFIPNCSPLSVFYGLAIDGVGVVVVEDEQIFGSSGGSHWNDQFGRSRTWRCLKVG